MELESYFEFLSDEDIRVKGTRIGIETILDDYFDGSSPEEISVRYLSLNLEQVYATITYYLSNRKKVDQYLDKWRRYTEETSKFYDENPTEAMKRLRHLKAMKTTNPSASS
ncbi:MAG: DUF433 domain-containing protein [bacterium]|nr:DUF433 domain-containing protein [bacterium]